MINEWLENKDFNNISIFAKSQSLKSLTINEKKPQTLTGLNLISPRKRHILPLCLKGKMMFYLYQALFKECKLEELLAESELKKAGMKTAETLI